MPPNTPSGTYVVVIRASDGGRTRIGDGAPSWSTPTGPTSAGPWLGAARRLDVPDDVVPRPRPAGRRRQDSTDRDRRLPGQLARRRRHAGRRRPRSPRSQAHARPARSRPATATELQVRARDAAGNWSAWAARPARSTPASSRTRAARLVAVGDLATCRNSQLSRRHGDATRRRPARRSAARSPAGRSRWVAADGPDARRRARLHRRRAWSRRSSQHRRRAPLPAGSCSRRLGVDGTHTIRIVVVGHGRPPRGWTSTRSW